MSPIAPTLQSFFIDRLAKQRRVSPRTIAYPGVLADLVQHNLPNHIACTTPIQVGIDLAEHPHLQDALAAAPATVRPGNSAQERWREDSRKP
ncbi:hypothetical protein EEB14_59385 [Rhodococcus sp. WS4]|nr:hypothetical protein EEB14_59385 [Rhodococcus sp. WS4]